MRFLCKKRIEKRFFIFFSTSIIFSIVFFFNFVHFFAYRKATEAILEDAKRGAEREKSLGVYGW